MNEYLPRPGDVIQIDPEHDETFGGCFATIDEVASWGCKCHFQVPGKEGVAHYRAAHGHFKVIGVAEWKLEEEGG